MRLYVTFVYQLRLNWTEFEFWILGDDNLQQWRGKPFHYQPQEIGDFCEIRKRREEGEIRKYTFCDREKKNLSGLCHDYYCPGFELNNVRIWNELGFFKRVQDFWNDP